MKRKAFVLPKIKEQQIDLAKFGDMLEEQINSKTMMSFYQDSDGIFKFLYTGLDVDAMAMLQILFDKNQDLLEFFKAAVISHELYRINEMDGFRYTKALVKYLRKV